MSVDRDDDPGLSEHHEQAPTAKERASDAADAPGLRERQLAEHDRYQKAVEASYQEAARDSWARAVPELRAAWEDHKQRYPERVRPAAQTQPDGSWVGDGSRRLTPEQNAEATKCCADIRDEAAEVIRPAIDRVAAADTGRRLAGLEHMLKGEDRLKEKIADELAAKPRKTVREALDDVADAVRFTLCYPAQSYAEGVLADVDRLKAEGFELIKLKNLWHADQYKGINSQWRVTSTGTRFEMQFHTPESREAKELTHEAYERIRGSDVTPAERRELRAFQQRANAQLTSPSRTPRSKTSRRRRRRTVADKITYYALVDDSTSRDHPAGILRRIENEEGEIDEVFSRSLSGSSHRCSTQPRAET